MECNKKKILLVEDEVLIAMVEKAELEKYGYVVETVISGEAAIERAAMGDGRIDLILMDIDLGPGRMDGTEAAKMVLAKKDIPIVFLSSHTDPGTVEKTEKITSYGYVVKNSGIIVMDASIKMALKLFEARLSERRKEEFLATTRMLLKAAFDSNLDPQLIFRSKRDSRGDIIDFVFQDLNNEAEKMLQMKRDDLIGRCMCDVLPINREAGFFEKYKKVVDTGIPLEEEFYLPETHVPAAWHHHLVTPIDDGIFISHRDITERKKTDELNRTLAQMLDVAPDSITVHDTEGNFLYANGKTFELHGYTEEEFVKINLHELDIPESEALIQERMDRIFSEGQAVFETAHYRKDGSAFPLEVSAKIVEWQGRNAVLSIATEIAERKEAERSFRENKERMQALLEANPDIMFLFDSAGVFIDCHASSDGKYFFPPGLFLGKHVSEVLPDYLARLTLEKLEVLLATGEPLTYEYQAEHEAELRFYETRLVPCGNDKALAIVRDITDRRRNMEYQKVSMQWFRQAFESAVPGFCFIGLDRRFIKVNASLSELFGYTEEELYSLTFQDITHPDDLDISDLHFDLLLQGKMDKAIFDKRYIRKNGSVLHASVATTLIRNENDEPEYFVTQVVDIEGNKTL